MACLVNIPTLTGFYYPQRSLTPNFIGEYPVEVLNGSLILVEFESNEYLPSDQTLNNYIDTYLADPYFMPPSQSITVGNLEYFKLAGELGELLYVSSGRNVYSIFTPINNLDEDQTLIDLIIGSIEFTTVDQVVTPVKETPNAIPFSFQASQGDGISALAVPNMKMPWVSTSTFNYNGVPHKYGDTQYKQCNPYVLSSLNGIDFSLKSNNEVLAIASGTISYYYEGTDTKGGRGNHIIVDHGGGWSTEYWHLTSVDPWVKAKERYIRSCTTRSSARQSRRFGRASESTFTFGIKWLYKWMEWNSY